MVNQHQVINKNFYYHNHKALCQLYVCKGQRMNLKRNRNSFVKIQKLKLQIKIRKKLMCAFTIFQNKNRIFTFYISIFLTRHSFFSSFLYLLFYRSIFHFSLFIFLIFSLFLLLFDDRFFFIYF